LIILKTNDEQFTLTTKKALHIIFKARLDKFWMHQDIKYNFMADLTRIGNRSVHKMSGL